jgi:hypothetical protein
MLPSTAYYVYGSVDSGWSTGTVVQEQIPLCNSVFECKKCVGNRNSSPVFWKFMSNMLWVCRVWRNCVRHFETDVPVRWLVKGVANPRQQELLTPVHSWATVFSDHKGPQKGFTRRHDATRHINHCGVLLCNLPGVKKRPARRADNLPTIWEPNIWKCGRLNLSQP